MKNTYSDIGRVFAPNMGTLTMKITKPVLVTYQKSPP